MTNDADLAAHFAADYDEGYEMYEDDVADEPCADEIEIPAGAYPFVVGYLACQHPDEVRRAVELWRQVEADAAGRLRAARELDAAALAAT